MVAKAFIRGHLITFTSDGWVYEDGVSIKVEKACARCHHMPTEKGHDFCLGELPNVRSACCGHGKEPGFILEKSDEE